VPLSPANATFLSAKTWHWAASGIDNLQDVPLLPGMEIWRFASSDQSDKWVANPWWVGKSAYQALCRLGEADKTSLTSTARACLAVVADPRAVARPNRMDVLSHARIAKPLRAWSGTPRTLRPKDLHSGHYLNRWEPDRAITQLFIPGLEVIWRDVLEATISRPIEPR
jgi:hypothetical protein